MSLKHLTEVYKQKSVPLFREKYAASKELSVPRILKVVVNIGIGRLKDDKERAEVEKTIQLITGQKPQGRPARIAIASFKLRKGTVIGYRVTLRGKRMYDFLERLVYVAIPRMRDFRGLSHGGIDEHGNMHIGIREHIIFPELIGEDVRRIFSLQVTIVTSSGSKERAHDLFKSLGFPLAKE